MFRFQNLRASFSLPNLSNKTAIVNGMTGGQAVVTVSFIDGLEVFTRKTSESHRRKLQNMLDANVKARYEKAALDTRKHKWMCHIF
jgi:hypothetical protein